ncbi:hypothetical protein FSU_0583 [Fibrobacter succinogenes subsp. succinogenes S85]|uniref:Uncharacterized protein n=1 Tax=Fibrobacter succinogenes (strain ATCC 19169 / S85) TaxID=59374 RepID=D9S759_FIBSS|nr:hypothetical protein FSU_0583 [Fibrobacter succinogenes subsp. succinogenes S85]
MFDYNDNSCFRLKALFDTKKLGFRQIPEAILL